MTVFKKGDKAILTIEVEVVNGPDGDGKVKVATGDRVVAGYVKPEHLTKIKPALPTKIGAVIRDQDGGLWVLSADGFWTHGTGWGEYPQDMANWDFEVLSEGVDV
jgi:hypothetical protein